LDFKVGVNLLPACKYYGICQLDTLDGDDCCILHSENLQKNQTAFNGALTEHLRSPAGDFRWFVFPGRQSFAGKNFDRGADFRDVTFRDTVSFSSANFPDTAYFTDVTFNGNAIFGDVTFAKGADFRSTKFKKEAGFIDAKFLEGRADFQKAEFGGIVYFWKSTFKITYFMEATFEQEADFTNAKFLERAWFCYAKFLGRALFIGGKDKKIFSGAEVDFRNVVINPLDALVIRDADLQKCRFLGTDLRKAELTNVTWPKLGKRDAVYDDISSIPMGTPTPREPAHLERLYRELKQNCEDRHDYEGASDFHYGEKEMRRQNPKTAKPLRWVLRLYRWISGYGEDYVRALECVLGLAVICAIAYFFCSRLPEFEYPSTWADWLKTALDSLIYSLRVMFHLKPEAMVEPVGLVAGSIFIFESVLGPVLIGLFGLALRQRLKR
jgi:uncharacterized protein YjbI with pentapeptide repeats